MSQADLSRSGFNISIDPRLLQLFVDGRELPIIVRGEDDGSFDDQDSVEFYGVGLDSPFTDSRVYWLTAMGQPGSRIKQVKSEALLSSTSGFTDKVERRDRSIYFAALLNGERENFFGAVITTNAVDQEMTISHLASASAGSTNPSIEVALQGVTLRNHRVRVELNASYLGEVAFNNQTQGSASFSVPASLLKEGGNTVRLVALEGASDVSLVDFIRISYQRSFIADNDALRLSATGSQEVNVDGFDSDSIRVVDVTDPRSPVEVGGIVSKQASTYAITFVAPETGERSLLAFAAPERPTAVSINRPSNLRQTNADLLIITRPEFADSLAPLVLLRRSQGMAVALIDAEDIYDEFSFGHKTPDAIKDFVVFTTTTSKRKPAFVLLAGDASLDPRNYLGLGDHDFVPTKLIDTAFMETASDDWFADANDDGQPELAVGRLPVRSAAEADTMVRKIIAYEQSNPSEELLLAADTIEGYDFEQASDQLSSLVPSDIKVTRIYRGRLDQTLAKKLIINSIQRGQKIVNYTGHGSANLWRGDLLTEQDAASFKGAGRYSVFVTMTCLNGYFQGAADESLAESLMRVENGGAVAVWASSGLTQPGEQAVMNQQFYRLLFGERGLALGEAAREAKAAVNDLDIKRTWILLGDPSMKLK